MFLVEDIINVVVDTDEGEPAQHLPRNVINTIISI